LPHKASIRGIGSFAGVRVGLDARVIDAAEWSLREREWLPTAEYRAYVASLMGRVDRPGQFAGWIALPAVGINRQPIDFEYVRFG
jgi:benzoyl-CoA 2,3-dioxygenase component B